MKTCRMYWIRCIIYSCILIAALDIKRVLSEIDYDCNSVVGSGDDHMPLLPCSTQEILPSSSFLNPLSFTSSLVPSSFTLSSSPSFSSDATSTVSQSISSSSNEVSHTAFTSSSSVLSTSSSSSTSISKTLTEIITTMNTPSNSPTATGGTDNNLLDNLKGIFANTTVTIAVAVGGSFIAIITIVICLFCCCCLCRRRRDRYSVEGEFDDAEVKGTRYNKRPLISDPIPTYRMALRQAQAQRERNEHFVETELGEFSTDDVSHYQGHSQVQHSQQHLTDVVVNHQSLPRLTPLNPSQMMSQIRGGISVDDLEEEIPEKDIERKDPRDNGGGDSPFMHLSDNLSCSRGRISQKSNSDHSTEIGNSTALASQMTENSQYSYLGLGVLHGGDVVFTNTTSLLEDTESSLGMIGIDPSLLASKDSDVHSHRTVSPLINSPGEDLDETPVREKPIKKTPERKISNVSVSSSVQLDKSTKEFGRLTSLPLMKTPDELIINELPRSSTPVKHDTTNKTSRKKLDLSLITSIPKSSDSEDSTRLTNSLTVDSDLQETPERQHRHTISSTDRSAFKRSTGKPSKLGKLTSLEYIRASLRMRLNKMKGVETDKNKKKPLKSALRKTNSISSNSSLDSPQNSRENSFSISNRHAMTPPYYNTYDDGSPHHHARSPHLQAEMYSPNHSLPPDDFPPPEMIGYGPGMGGYPYGPGYPPIDPYMVGLSPPPFNPDLLSPILSVSQFDHPGMYYPQSHEIGILPPYGAVPVQQMGHPHDPYIPLQPPGFDDDDDDMPALHSPYRHIDQGGSASQRNVTWNLEPQEIPIVDLEELTPSDIEDDR